MFIKAEADRFLTQQQIQSALAQELATVPDGAHVLLLPPDFTRAHSGAGSITAFCYSYLQQKGCQIDIMPALGTHRPMTREEADVFFKGMIPYENLLLHHWRSDTLLVGEVPTDFVREISSGLVNNSIPVEINRRLLSGEYDLIYSIGQVVPHEVCGMANYTKNILVGCGGPHTINGSHMLGAFCDLEKAMGRDHAPVRRLFDYAEEHFLYSLPLRYILTTVVERPDTIGISSLGIGRERDIFTQSVACSQERNITHLPRPLHKVVVWLDPSEFHSTWLGNKAVYRTRLAIASGGELVVLAPGVKTFGEDDVNDRLIRKYGYTGRNHILSLLQDKANAKDLQENLSAAAHLIHGSSDGRFSVTYATNPQLLSREEVESVGYRWLAYNSVQALYPIDSLHPGENHLPGGEDIYYIPNPALGLWQVDDPSIL